MTGVRGGAIGPWLLIMLALVAAPAAPASATEDGAAAAGAAPAADGAPPAAAGSVGAEPGAGAQPCPPCDCSEAPLAHRLDAQQEALARIERRLARALSAPDAEPAPSAAAGTPAERDDADPLQERHADLERRYRLLVERYAAVQQERAEQASLAASARAERAALEARLQQQGLLAQEAQARADKAEKLAAATDEAHARLQTENERLRAALATAETRHGEALQQVVTLERKLATAEARLADAESRSAETGAGAPEPDAAGGRPGAADADADADADAPDEAAPAAAGAGASPRGSATAETPAAGGVIQAPVIYRVRPGDTLSRISARVYGDAAAWRRIYDANRDLLESPDDLGPGMMLVVP